MTQRTDYATLQETIGDKRAYGRTTTCCAGGTTNVSGGVVATFKATPKTARATLKALNF